MISIARTAFAGLTLVILAMPTCMHPQYKPDDDGNRFGRGAHDGWVATWGGTEECDLFIDEGGLLMGDAYQNGRELFIDDQGFIYVAGVFGEKADFNPGPDVSYKSSPGSFLSRFASDGTWQWTKTWDGHINDLDIRPGGDLYICGGESREVDLDISRESSLPSERTLETGYLARFSTDGEFAWAEFTDVIPSCIEVTDDGKILMAGLFESTVDMNPGDGDDIFNPVGQVTCYISEFTTDGQYIRTVTLNGVTPENPSEDEDPAPGYARIQSIVSDDNGAIYLAGTFHGIVDFDPGSGVDEMDAGRFSGNYLCRLNGLDDYAWAKSWGSCWGSQTRCGIGPDGDIFVTGAFQWFDDFDPGPGEDMHEVVNDYDVYLTRFTPDGDHVWALTWGGWFRDEAGDITFDRDGNILLTGTIQEAADLDPGLGEDIHEGAEAGGTYIIKLNDNGDYIWGRSLLPEGRYRCNGNSILVDNAGYIYLTGDFAGIVDFDPGDGEELHASVDGWDDAFLIKLSADGEW